MEVASVTLVIAGHSLRDMGFSRIGSSFCDGIFFVADSSITQGDRLLVSGFKKVVETPVRVAGMNFLDDWFNGYLGYNFEGGCGIAFAGSTLVAQHILNSIRNHLSDLRPTYLDGKYQLAMPCETKKFLNGYYDVDMFQKHHLGTNHLLSAGFIAQVVKHSVESVLIQAKKHKSMKSMFSAYKAEFILGICCPETRKHHIYRYDILESSTEDAVVSMEEIPEGKVAVIGLRKFHEQEANDAFAEAVANGRSTGPALFDFLAKAIKAQNEIGVFEIGFPAFHYKVEGIRLEHLSRRES